jgi:hypothetical protein
MGAGFAAILLAIHPGISLRLEARGYSLLVSACRCSSRWCGAHRSWALDRLRAD